MEPESGKLATLFPPSLNRQIMFREPRLYRSGRPSVKHTIPGLEYNCECLPLSLKFDKQHFASRRAEQGFFRASRPQFYLALQSSICAEVAILNRSRSDWSGSERPVPGG